MEVMGVRAMAIIREVSVKVSKEVLAATQTLAAEGLAATETLVAEGLEAMETLAAEVSDQPVATVRMLSQLSKTFITKLSVALSR
jgi:hypothetical protein